jgi:hypothetical protein
MARPREQWRHLALLISILFLFVVAPVVAMLGQGVLILNIVSAAVLVAGCYALSERKRIFVTAVALSVLSVVGTGLLLVRPEPWTAIFSHSCIVVLIIFFCITILGHVLSNTPVTMDKIFAAICVYLLLGYAWTFGYALVEEVGPNSFGGLSASPIPNDYVARILQLRYYSFITLTTVGYGDIVPRSAAARTLAALEAIIGQIYLTVLVARLVGLHIVHASDSRAD